MFPALPLQPRASIAFFPSPRLSLDLFGADAQCQLHRACVKSWALRSNRCSMLPPLLPLLLDVHSLLPEVNKKLSLQWISMGTHWDFEIRSLNAINSQTSRLFFLESHSDSFVVLARVDIIGVLLQATAFNFHLSSLCWTLSLLFILSFGFRLWLYL